uniref:Uncharacterized protein n=1 Tax=Arundo donax TaxID=35708 RepID=A0A0A9HI74_ARUDO
MQRGQLFSVLMKPFNLVRINFSCFSYPSHSTFVSEKIKRMLRKCSLNKVLILKNKSDDKNKSDVSYVV